MTNNTFKKHKVGNFTVIDNNIFKNKKMSLKSKGLLALMLSLPDEWEYSERGLTVLSTDGRDSIRSGLRELEELGYLIRKQIRNEVGQLVGNQYNVYEEPKLVQPLLEKPILVNTPNKELSNKVLTDKELTNTKDYVCFETFWNSYPKKVAKGQAIKTFDKIVKDEETLELIVTDLNKRKNFEGWNKEKGKYIPNPSTYLNNLAWNDSYEETIVNHIEEEDYSMFESI